ncbi:MAG: ParA family protein [Candidatus Limnocylindria bacterium]|nr:MAG: sporulation initiation inhibitor Soj [Chloroflexota bacterium]
MVRVTACTNQKGGVGKTTTVVNLAAYLALSGIPTLVIDLDPQGNATSGLGIDRRTVGRSIYEALVDRTPLPDVTVGTAIEGLDLVPSTQALAGAEVELVDLDGRERRLAASLDSLGNRYDRVLIDCPPSLGLLTLNALTAADGVLIPLQTEYYALEGLTQLVNTIRLVRESLNPRLQIEGVLLTMFDGRTNLSAQVAAEVRRHMNGRVYRTVVPRSVRLSEAPSHGLPIAIYDPGSRGADAYRALAGEVTARG